MILTADPALLHAINRLADAFILSGAKAPETTHNGNGHTALRSDPKDLPQAPGPEPQLDELPKKQPKKKPAPDPEPSERKDATVTLEDIQALSREKAQAGKKEGIKAALSRYQIAKISDLNPIDYLGFHLTISAL